MAALPVSSGSGADAVITASDRVAGDALTAAPLGDGRGRVPAATFAALFCEVVAYFQNSIESLDDLERKLECLGHDVGQRMLEPIWLRTRPKKREVDMTKVLQFLSDTAWPQLFDRPADGLQASTEHDNQFMLYDDDPLTNRAISVPADHGGLNCGAFIAGIIRGMLDAMAFPAEVAAHTVEGGSHISGQRTVFVIKFDEDVVQRAKMQKLLRS